MRKLLVLLLVLGLVIGCVGVVSAETTAGESSGTPTDGSSGTPTDGSSSTPTDGSSGTPTATTATPTATATVSDSNYKVSIEATPLKGVAPLVVAFKINTTIPVSDQKKIEWEFGYDNDSFSSKESPSYTYEKSGTYTVTLSITTKISGKEYSAESVKITVSDIDASFTASKTSGAAPLAVKFTDTSSGAISWAWSIYKTDGGSRTLQKEMTDRNISYTFQNAGEYEVELIAKKGSHSASETKKITVSAKATTAPTTKATTKATTAPTTAATTMEVRAAALSADDSPVPNPMDIIEEFIRLLKVMLVPDNYTLAP